MKEEDDCSIIYCEDCGATNVLQINKANSCICPEELLECWSCGAELLNADPDTDTNTMVSSYVDHLCSNDILTEE